MCDARFYALCFSDIKRKFSSLREEVSKILLFIFISPIPAFCVIVPSFKCVDAAFAIYSVRNGIQRQTAFLSGLLVDQCDCVHSFFMKKIRIQPFNAKHEYDY